MTDRRSHIMLLLLLFAGAILQYANTSGHDFAYDDVIVFQENSRIQRGIEGIPDLFINREGMALEYRYGYRPVTLLTFALQWEFFGADPAPGHWINILFYAILCLVVFQFLRRWFPSLPIEWALGITLVFLVHPVHTEVVANIKSRDAILAMLFGLLFLIRLTKTLEAPSTGGSLLTVVLLLCSLLSLESGIAFGLLGLILVIFKLNKPLWPEKSSWILPAGALAVGVGFMILSETLLKVRMDDAAVAAQGRYVGLIGNPLLGEVSFSQKLATAFLVLGKYSVQALTGGPLIHDYSTKVVEIASWTDWRVILSALVHIGLMVAAFLKRDRFPVLFQSLIIYFVLLSPFLHIPITGPDIYADRFLFAPLLGFWCFAGVALFRIFRLTGSIPSVKAVLGGIFLLLMGYFAVQTVQRNRDWKDNLTLFRADLEKVPECARMHYNYAVGIDRRGVAMPGEYAAHLEEAIEITPLAYQAFTLLGQHYMGNKQFDKAYPVFSRLYENYPEVADAAFFLGKYHATANQFGEAVPLLEKAVRLDSTNGEAWLLLGLSQCKSGDMNGGIDILKTGEKFNQNEAHFFYLSARLAWVAADTQLTRKWIQRAVKLAPENPGYASFYQSVFQ